MEMVKCSSGFYYILTNISSMYTWVRQPYAHHVHTSSFQSTCKKFTHQNVNFCNFTFQDNFRCMAMHASSVVNAACTGTLKKLPTPDVPSHLEE